MNRTTMLAAAALAVLGGVLYALHLRHFESKVQGGETVGVVVMIGSLDAGDTVSRVMLGIRQVPQRFVEDRHVRSANLIRVLGTATRRDLEVGSWLTWDDVGGDIRDNNSLSNAVAEGMRAFTLVMESSSFGLMVAGGDHVDILMSAPQPYSETQTAPLNTDVPALRLTTVLLQNVRVISVGQRREANNSQIEQADADREARVQERKSAKNVTIEISLQDAIALQHAIMYADLISLVVRNPEDGSIVQEIPITTDLDLIEAEERARRQFRRRRGPTKIVNLGGPG